jgi:NO-binding membrane sensor protein with MHYT domain
MRASSANVAESSLLLWALSAVVVILAGLVVLGWLRQAHLNPHLRQRWRATLIAAATFATGICASVVLSLSAEALSFPLGYRLRDVPLLLVGTVLAVWPAMILLGLSRKWYATVGGGLWLGLVTVVIEMGWVNAVGFRPGITWRWEFVAAAALLLVLGISTALRIGFSESSLVGPHHRSWRLGAAAMLSLSILVGQEVLLSGAGLLVQVGSVFRTEVPAPLLCLVFGVVAPLALAMMMFDLRMRRSQQRRETRRTLLKRRQEAADTLSGANSSFLRDTQAGTPETNRL